LTRKKTHNHHFVAQLVVAARQNQGRFCIDVSSQGYLKLKINRSVARLLQKQLNL
jgi:hypothetical protein